MPVWIVGIMGALCSCWLSGRINKRWPFILPAICVSLVGWVIHYKQVQPAQVRYLAQFLISFGTYITMPLYIGLLTANLRGRASRSFGTAIQLGLGNCANFVSSNIFITTQAPKYPVGFGTGLAITAFSFPLMLFVMLLFTIHNGKLAARSADLGSDAGELDEHRDYVYIF